MKKTLHLTDGEPAKARGLLEQQVQDFVVKLVNANVAARAAALAIKARVVDGANLRITFTEPLTNGTASRTKARETDAIAQWIKRPVEVETKLERPDRIPVVRVNPRALYVTVDAEGNAVPTPQPTKQGWATAIAYAINGLVQLVLCPSTVKAGSGRTQKHPHGWNDYGRAAGLDIGKDKDGGAKTYGVGTSGECRFTGRGQYALDPETHARVVAFAQEFGMPRIQGPDYAPKASKDAADRPEFLLTFTMKDSKGRETDVMEDAESGAVLVIKTTKTRATILADAIKQTGGRVTLHVSIPADGAQDKDTDADDVPASKPAADRLAGKTLAEKVAKRNRETGAQDKPSETPAAETDATKVA